MANLSAGVEVNEIDLSIIVPTVSTSIAAFAGEFTKGPIGQSLLITNVDDLKMYYGKPITSNYNDWYQVYNFLQYGDKIYISRVGDRNGMKNSVGELSSDGITVLSATPNLIMNEDDYALSEISYPFVDVATSKFKFFARTPGTWGNKIRVVVANEAALSSKTQELYQNSGIIIGDLFQQNIDQTNGEIVVVVLEGDKIVERHVVSVIPTALDSKNGKSIYIEKVINRISNYIYVKDNTNVTYPYSDVTPKIKDLVLSSGTDGNVVIGNYEEAYSVFSNKETIEIDIIIGNENAHRAAANLAGNRKDCIGFLGAKRDDVVGVKSAIAIDNMVQYVTSDFNIGDALGKYNSYFGNYKYQYSTELDEYIWVNIAGDAAGLRALANTTLNTWDASAGIDNGSIKNCIKLAINLSQGERDILYKNMINPVVSFIGQGTVIWGNKTLQSKPSSFDRINVRGLFNQMERAISKMAKYYVFANNTHFTRTRFKATIEPYLRSIKSNNGIYDFFVRCDSTNNTPQIIDSNQFIADIAIKPTRTAEFLVLNFIAVGTGVDFNEIFA